MKGALCRPKPVQSPHIPVWVAGGGERVTLRIAATHASHTNFGFDLEEFNHKSEVLAKHCQEVGTDYESIVRSSNFVIVCAESEREVQEKKRWVRDRFNTYVSKTQAELAAAEYNQMSGTPDQVIERLQAWEKAGMSYAIIYFPDAAFDLSSLHRFASEVIPALA